MKKDRQKGDALVKEHFSEQLEVLRRNLILMGGEVERQIQHAIEALTEVDEKKAAEVIAADSEIDRMEMVIEEQAVHLLALQQPVAVDLRFLVAALKINNDLERIGDHAVNIAEGAERLAGQKPFKPFIDINYMAEVAMSMLKQSLDAFVNRDASLAKQVIKKDDILDDKNVSIIRELLTYMAEYPNLITYCLELISISKNLERVGDLASNICEDTIYMAEARWVKHHATELI
jgi:phosphate transport system protein